MNAREAYVNGWIYGRLCRAMPDYDSVRKGITKASQYPVTARTEIYAEASRRGLLGDNELGKDINMAMFELMTALDGPEKPLPVELQHNWLLGSAHGTIGEKLSAPDGAQIANMRKAQGMTQEELAKAIGVSSGLLSRWESGNGAPSPAQTNAIYQALFKVPAYTPMHQDAYEWRQSHSEKFFEWWVQQEYDPRLPDIGIVRHRLGFQRLTLDYLCQLLHVPPELANNIALYHGAIDWAGDGIDENGYEVYTCAVSMGFTISCNFEQKVVDFCKEEGIRIPLECKLGKPGRRPKAFAHYDKSDIRALHEIDDYYLDKAIGRWNCEHETGSPDFMFESNIILNHKKGKIAVNEQFLQWVILDGYDEVATSDNDSMTLFDVIDGQIDFVGDEVDWDIARIGSNAQEDGFDLSQHFVDMLDAFLPGGFLKT